MTSAPVQSKPHKQHASPTASHSQHDSVMGDWMGYVYQQKPLPTNFKGVTVDISVLDANGNYRSIGTATTDANGNYNLIWTPDISGNYQVVATFAGTNGYWPSIYNRSIQRYGSSTQQHSPTTNTAAIGI